ncbi:MAG: hypothetical protein AB8B85_02460 [Paracoccaceae bacterium]
MRSMENSAVIKIAAKICVLAIDAAKRPLIETTAKMGLRWSYCRVWCFSDPHAAA